MGLVLTLKPQERIILGGAVVRNNGAYSARLLIETPVPILRCPDILPESDVNTPCGRIYMAIELMYLQPEQNAEYMKLYITLTEELVAAVPSMTPILQEISPLVISGEYYKALQKMKLLLKREKNLLELASSAT
jgi:flagellar protein FlbT